MQVRRLSGLDGLRELRAPWVSLHSRSGLYSRHEWHLACATHLLRDAGSLTYLQFIEDERTVAIVPIIASIESVRCFGRVHAISVGLHDHLSLADIPMASDASVEDIADALAEELVHWNERWDVLLWPRILAGSNLMRLAENLKKFSVNVIPAAPCNTLDTSQPFKELSAGFSKNLRSSLRKSEQRLADSGGATLATNGIVTGQDGAADSTATAQMSDTERAYEQFLVLEGSGWKGEAGTASAIGLNPALRGFYAELLAQRGKDFAAEVTCLLRGDAPIAAQFSVHTSDWRHVLKIGYNESESKFSPGQVLMARVLEHASNIKVTRVSLVTDMPWHHTWRPLAEPTCNVMIFRRRWRALVYRACVGGLRKTKLALLAMLFLLELSD
ncbi:MAG: GNAT family N-acetyltransferase [Betaproteobacteria bacterium]